MSDGLVFVLSRSREHLFRTDFFPYLCFTEGFEFQTFVVMKRREVDRLGDFLDGAKQVLPAIECGLTEADEVSFFHQLLCWQAHPDSVIWAWRRAVPLNIWTYKLLGSASEEHFHPPASPVFLYSPCQAHPFTPPPSGCNCQVPAPPQRSLYFRYIYSKLPNGVHPL